jgi:hypothetical protein
LASLVTLLEVVGDFEPGEVVTGGTRAVVTIILRH